MPALSRREFGRAVVAGLPAAAMLGAAQVSGRGHIVVGVSTSSLRGLPRVEGLDNVDDVTRVMRAVRATHLELALANVEPAPPETAPFMGGSPAYPQLIVLSPEQVAAINVSARKTLRTWRARTPVSAFEQTRRKFVAAGLTVQSCSVAYNDSFTDEEIEATFRQVKALGATTISSPLTMAMAARLVPYAERHQIAVAIHNQVDGNASGFVATADLKGALALSPAFRVKLDIGNITASNRDPVREFATHQSRLSHVLVKDRLRNGGASQPFGEGDTPIAAVLDAAKASARPVPAFVEYDYVGLHPIADEVATLVAYVAARAS